MHKFRPTRASPPSKPVLLPDHTLDSLHTSVSRSSAGSVPELTGLTEQEVELLDAVIQRAGHSATTFLAVFKAYNDVLNERGLDPHEVLYYGKLLKLGTLKGRNWGDKWSMVKKQYNYEGSHSDTHAQAYSQTRISNPLLKHTSGRVKPQPSHDPEGSFTLYSRADESEAEMDQDTASISQAKSQQLTHFDELKQFSGIHEFGRKHLTGLTTRQVRGLPDSSQQDRRWEIEVSDTMEEYIPMTPPPYPVLRDSRVYKEKSSARSPAIPAQPPEGDIARKVVALARQRSGSVVNEQDAWNKIKMERDERDADNFRSDRLLERCWDVWKQGFQWIIVGYLPSFVVRIIANIIPDH